MKITIIIMIIKRKNCFFFFLNAYFLYRKFHYKMQLQLSTTYCKNRETHVVVGSQAAVNKKAKYGQAIATESKNEY